MASSFHKYSMSLKRDKIAMMLPSKSHFTMTEFEKLIDERRKRDN